MARRNLTHETLPPRGGHGSSSDSSQGPDSMGPFSDRNRESITPPLENRYLSESPTSGSTFSLINGEHNRRYSNDYGYPQQLHPSESFQEDKSQNDSSNLLSYPDGGLHPAQSDLSPFGGYPPSQFPLYIDEREDDDHLHNPDPIADGDYDKNRFWYDLKTMDRYSFCNFLSVIVFGLMVVSVMTVLPVLTFSQAITHHKSETAEILTAYSYPLSSAIRTSLIDPDTPESALTKQTFDGEDWVLTFSDEFNAEGRTFYEGDDQFFQAVDLHYQATMDLEWYDPDAVTTANGTLILKLDAYKNHNLFYRSGMVQSWNKLCYTQGSIDISARLPGYGDISGLWPGLWTMGNLGRPGYLATTDGVWPYTYESCDAGITANQSSSDGISYLPGQRLNACTCSGQEHPNTGIGRGAPEIDIVEANVDNNIKLGAVSQSFQIAPFDVWYTPDYNFVKVYNDEISSVNSYVGSPFQQAVSCLTTLNQAWYQYGENSQQFQTYGYEYLNGDDSGYITWHVGQNPTFTIQSYSLGPNGNIGFRRISKEPMSVVMNLGLANNWSYIDWLALVFPSQMEVDYIRIYQPPGQISMTCDPDDFPTAEYISAHPKAYQNVNFTHWEDAGYSWPKNKLVHGC